ncbi:MAG: LTA synthase family protein [Solobacterium sp.]|nr:LTA synthase family protein [Solobacterium sp.]
MKNILVLTLCLLLDLIILKTNINSDIYIVALLIDVLFILCICSFIYLFKNSKKISIFIMSVFTLYCLSQNIYYLFFNSFYSLMNIANALDLSGIKINLLSKLKPDLLLYLLPATVYFVYINNNRKDNLSIDIRISRSSVLMGICLMILINILNPASIIAQELWSKEDLYNYLSMRNKAEFIEKFGIGSYIRKDIELTASDDSLNKDELNYWIDNNRELSENNEYTDIFKDKNLIILQSESLSVNAINENITPNLFRLKNEGIFFSNFYAPLYPANTSDSEFIIQSSIIPSLNNGITCYEYGDTDFRETLPLLFKNKGYSVNSYHSYFENYYNRNNFHKALGFDNYYGLESLFIDEKIKYEEEYWTDDYKLIEAYLNNRNSDKYYSLIITASGHLPYDRSRAQLNDNYLKIKESYPEMNDELAYYYASLMKYDDALGLLINNLNENDVLVIVGDHYPYGLNAEAQSELMPSDYKKFKTPFIIYTKDIEHKEINKCCSTFDILPTLANMFGFEIKEYHTGKDIFSENDSAVYFSDGSLIINDEYIDSGEEYLKHQDVYFYCQEILKNMKKNQSLK